MIRTCASDEDESKPPTYNSDRECVKKTIPKLSLEIVSIIRYLFLGKIKYSFAQISALLWVIFHPIYLLKRFVKINKIKRYSLSSILGKMYKGSIVFSYYLLSKKKYSDFN